jgi:hypothetical protein
MADMSGQPLPKLVLGIALVGASIALAAAGATSLTTDARAPRVNASQEQAPIPPVPPATVAPPIGDDAFTRPMFNRNRALGPDKAPPAPADSSDPSTSPSASNAPDATGDMSDMTIKGIIVTDRGARAALQAPGSNALTWVSAGDTIDGWKVERITADSVRISNGDEVTEIRIRDDQ